VSHEPQHRAARIAALDKIIAAPTEREAAEAERAALVRQEREEREADGRTRAEERLGAIAHDHDQLLARLDRDAQAVEESAAALAARIADVNTAYAAVGDLVAEARALAHRFGLGLPALGAPVPPFRRGIALELPALADHDHRYLQPAPTEQDDTGLRVRRTYAEIGGSPGFALIQAAGLRPFPELTARQRELAADHEHVAERERRAAAEARALAAAERPRVATRDNFGRSAKG